MRLICDQFVSGARFLWYNLNRIATKVSTFQRHDFVELATVGESANKLVVINEIGKKKDKRMEVMIAQQDEMLKLGNLYAFSLLNPYTPRYDILLACVIINYVVIIILKSMIKLKACEDQRSRSMKDLLLEILTICAVNIVSDIQRITRSCPLIPSLPVNSNTPEDIDSEERVSNFYQTVDQYGDKLVRKVDYEKAEWKKLRRYYEELNNRCDDLDAAMRIMSALTKMNRPKVPAKYKYLELPDWNSWMTD